MRLCTTTGCTTTGCTTTGCTTTGWAARGQGGLLLAFVSGFLLVQGCRAGEPLPKIAQVPSFEMLDQDGQAVSASDLQGRVSIVSFIFTSCPDVCPLLMNQLSGIRTKLLPERARVRFVSISVDPENDTPPVLKAFAAKHGADYPDWRLLTGPLQQLRAVVVEGFMQSLDRGDGTPAGIMHGSHFVLVDRKGFMRGFYRSDEEGGLRLARDARLLLAEKE